MPSLVTDGGATETISVTSPLCRPARASEDLRARIDVTMMGPSPSAMPGQRVVHTSEIFDRFNTNCGGCHVSTTNGGRHTTAGTFAMDFDATWLAAIKSEDAKMAMPPENRAYSSRPEGDPVRQMVALIEPWLAQGRPADLFTVDDATAGGGTGTSGYSYSALTNLGDCIPDDAMYASSSSTEMESKDQLFAGATALPRNLTDTDLTTFDADILGANGVVAFVPTYPLYSDGSGKLRHIRVPKGTSVKFDKAKQSFDIPTNTRFYKTFFRKVIDGTGHETNRKMETRLIVARPDTLETDGKTPHPNALFGTYVWSEDEMTATLLDVPYRDGTPFADKTEEYVTNEIDYHDVVNGLPPAAGQTFSERLRLALLDHPDLVRHYAIPGSIRCVQCHRGSPGNNFVLGFFPLQLARRATGAGGTYEPTGEDELNQLQRLVDYGVISGMRSPADVVPLEQTQAPRKPRTPQELTAQGYMVGNCAHCHNPRGYPSLAKPELATVLNFFAGPDSGIFEFPLERMSPVRSRGANQDVPFPYITPSLRDYPVATSDGTRLDNGALIAPASGSSLLSEQTWSPKYSESLFSLGCAKASTPDDRSYCGSRRTGLPFVAAPWRSLIYRNVDTPFPYFDDYVPFPHMPMNSPGFDCRAPRIMGDWMVSLPALRKRPSISEDVLPKSGSKHGDGTFDDTAQPYVEVTPDQKEYAAAQKAAQDRLAEYHASVRYQYCQDVLGKDIFDPIGALGGFSATDPKRSTYLPDLRYAYGVGAPVTDPQHPGDYVQPQIGVPYHSHWFAYDPTDSPPPWKPRRADAWKTTLMDRVPDLSPPAGFLLSSWMPNQDGHKFEDEMANRARVVDAVNQAQLTDELRAYATTELPYGLWQAKPECQTKLAAMKKVSDPSFTGSNRPVWMDNPGKKPAADAAVFMMSPGGALYRHICFNCHGPRADGKGLQGDALAASSEGQARPANFVEGLFGPSAAPGQNLINVFGSDGRDPRTALTWGSRYMSWMTLGGTLQLIPTNVINQVQATRILGEPRKHIDVLGEAGGVSANMLTLAKGLCSVVLPDQTAAPMIKSDDFESGYPPMSSTLAPFVTSNGDWEMWMNLCSRYNLPVVRIYGIENQGNHETPNWTVTLKALYYASGDPGGGSVSYPDSAPVLDHLKSVQTGIRPDNYYPACLQKSGDLLPGESPPLEQPSAALAQTALLLTHIASWPECPTDFLAHGKFLSHSYAGNLLDPDPAQLAEIDNLKNWTLRGAINAGMSVFSYLYSQAADLSRNGAKPYYNECQLLP